MVRFSCMFSIGKASSACDNSYGIVHFHAAWMSLCDAMERTLAPRNDTRAVLPVRPCGCDDGTNVMAEQKEST